MCPVQEPGNGPAFGLSLVPRFSCAQYKSLGMGLLLVLILSVDVISVWPCFQAIYCANVCGIAAQSSWS